MTDEVHLLIATNGRVLAARVRVDVRDSMGSGARPLMMVGGKANLQALGLTDVDWLPGVAGEFGEDVVARNITPWRLYVKDLVLVWSSVFSVPECAPVHSYSRSGRMTN